MNGTGKVPDESGKRQGPHGTRKVTPGDDTTKELQTPRASLFQIAGTAKFVLVSWQRNQRVRVFVLQRSHAERLIVDEAETGAVVPSGDHRTIGTSWGYLNIPAHGKRGNGMLGQVPVIQLGISRFVITYDGNGKPANFTPKH